MSINTGDMLDALTASKHLADKPKQYFLITTPSGPYRNPFLDSFYKSVMDHEYKSMPLLIGETDFGIDRLKRAFADMEESKVIDNLNGFEWYNQCDLRMAEIWKIGDGLEKQRRLLNKRKAMRYAVSTKTKPATYSFKAFATTHRLQTKVRRRAKWHQIPRLQAKYRL
jgi:hypothetical protein